MIRVGVVGAAGRMGTEVCRAVLGAHDLELVAAVDAKTSDLDLGADGAAVETGSEMDVLVRAGAEVAVDFTVAAAAREHLAFCAAAGIHAVVGTTGLNDADLATAREAFERSSANAVIAANFAIGAVLLMRFCELAAPFMDGVEIIELHHNAKVDAPSGTALRTAERIAAARDASTAGAWAADATRDVVLDGARGADTPAGVHIHSVRLPGLIAHEEVIFGAPGQSLTLRHDSYDRASFMPGVLLAVRHVAQGPSLTIGLDPLLGV